MCDARFGEGCPKQYRLLVYSRGGAQLGCFQQPLWKLTRAPDVQGPMPDVTLPESLPLWPYLFSLLLESPFPISSSLANLSFTLCDFQFKKKNNPPLFFAVLGIEPRALPMLGKCSTTKPYPQICLFYTSEMTRCLSLCDLTQGPYRMCQNPLPI